MTFIESKVVCILPWLYKQVLEPSFFFARLFLACINQPQLWCHGEVKLCAKMARFDTKKSAVASLKRIPKGKKMIQKRKRTPWLSGKKKKRQLPQLLKGAG